MTIKGHLFTPDMPLLAILNLHVAFIAGHSNIKATAYHAEIITNSFPRHDSYVALCSASALARRQADSVVALYRLLLPFLSPTKLLSLSLSVFLVSTVTPCSPPFRLLKYVLFSTSSVISSSILPPPMSLNPPARNVSLDKGLVGRLPH